MCGEAVARLVAARGGSGFDGYRDLLGGAARPVAVPVSLGALAGLRPGPSRPEAPLDTPGGTA
jgi:hypothetical protein